MTFPMQSAGAYGWKRTVPTRAATQRLINLRTSTQVNVAEEDKSDDFSKEEPSVFSRADKEIHGRLSGVGRQSAPVVRANSISSRRCCSPAFPSGCCRKRNTSSTRKEPGLQHGRSFARIVDHRACQSGRWNGFVNVRQLRGGGCGGLAERCGRKRGNPESGNGELTKLLDAPVVDAFVGPAILSGRASGVFFHEIFGHRIEGHRQKDESDQQTFTKMVGSKVLPDFLSVLFDPTRKKMAGTDLNGWYLYDDEGVKARPVRVVENGH